MGQACPCYVRRQNKPQRRRECDRGYVAKPKKARAGSFTAKNNAIQRRGRVGRASKEEEGGVGR